MRRAVGQNADTPAAALHCIASVPVLPHLQALMMVASLLQSWQWVRRGVLGYVVVPLAEFFSMRYLVRRARARCASRARAGSLGLHSAVGAPLDKLRARLPSAAGSPTDATSAPPVNPPSPAHFPQSIVCSLGGLGLRAS